MCKYVFLNKIKAIVAKNSKFVNTKNLLDH